MKISLSTLDNAFQGYIQRSWDGFGLGHLGKHARVGFEIQAKSWRILLAQNQQGIPVKRLIWEKAQGRHTYGKLVIWKTSPVRGKHPNLGKGQGDDLEDWSTWEDSKGGHWELGLQEKAGGKFSWRRNKNSVTFSHSFNKYPLGWPGSQILLWNHGRHHSMSRKLTAEQARKGLRWL